MLFRSAADPLWPETVETIRRVLEKKKQSKDPADVDRVFITKYGMPWGKDIADSPITKETRKLLDELGINGTRNFYTLRHTFRTVADCPTPSGLWERCGPCSSRAASWCVRTRT